MGGGNWVCFAYCRGTACRARTGIGFVLHNLAVGFWRLAVGLGELGSFRVFWLLAFGDWLLAWGNWVRFVFWPGVDWVRFVYLGLGKPARRQRYGGIGFVWHFLVRRLVGWAETCCTVIGFVSRFLAVGLWRLAVGLGELGSFRIFGSMGRWGWGKLGSFRKFAGWNWVRFAFFGHGEANGMVAGEVNWVRFAFFGGGGRMRLGLFRIIRPDRSGGNPDFEIPGSKRDAAVGWARFVTPPVFGVASSLIMGCIIPQNRSKVKDQSAKLWYRPFGYAPLDRFGTGRAGSLAMWFLLRKSRKRILNHEGTKGHEVKGGFLIDKLLFTSYDLLFWVMICWGRALGLRI